MNFLKFHLIAFFALAVIPTSVTVAAETGTAESVPKPEGAPSAMASPAELITMRCLMCHGNPTAGTRRLRMGQATHQGEIENAGSSPPLWLDALIAAPRGGDHCDRPLPPQYGFSDIRAHYGEVMV